MPLNPFSTEVFLQFKEEVLRRFDRQDDSLDKIIEYQREQNGKVFDLSKIVAAHEAKIVEMKDSRGRLITFLTAGGVALFSWILHWWKG